MTAAALTLKGRLLEFKPPLGLYPPSSALKFLSNSLSPDTNTEAAPFDQSVFAPADYGWRGETTAGIFTSATSSV